MSPNRGCSRQCARSRPVCSRGRPATVVRPGRVPTTPRPSASGRSGRRRSSWRRSTRGGGARDCPCAAARACHRARFSGIWQDGHKVTTAQAATRRAAPVRGGQFTAIHATVRISSSIWNYDRGRYRAEPITRYRLPRLSCSGQRSRSSETHPRIFRPVSSAGCRMHS